MSESKKYYWHGSGVLPYRGKALKKGDEVPEGALDKSRLAHFIRLGKISDKEVSDPVGSQERLLTRIAELEGIIKKNDNLGVKREIATLKSDNLTLTTKVETLTTELEAAQAAAKAEGIKDGVLAKIFKKKS